MLRDRLIFGSILIALLLLLPILDDWLESVTLTGFWKSVFLGKDHLPGGLLLFGLGLLIAPLAARELSVIFRAQGIETRTWLTATAAAAGLALSYCVPTSGDTSVTVDALTAIAIVATGMILVFVIALLTFSRNQNVQGVVAAAGAVMFAMVYLGFMFGFLLALRREHSAWMIVGVILVTKSCDTGAYFTGRAIGRHKLIPWLSPGKTWEGLAGGIVLAMLMGAGMAWLSQVSLELRDHVPIWVGLLCGAVFAVVGQCGDLVMSLLKRGAGLKDSSTLLPGLGGALDVLDSPLLVAPVAFWILELTAG